MCLRSRFVGCAVLVFCQNLLSYRIGFIFIGLDVCGVWLIYKIGHVLIIGSELFQQHFPGRFLPILLSGRPIVDIGCRRPRLRL